MSRHRHRQTPTPHFRTPGHPVLTCFKHLPERPDVVTGENPEPPRLETAGDVRVAAAEPEGDGGGGGGE